MKTYETRDHESRLIQRRVTDETDRRLRARQRLGLQGQPTVGYANVGRNHPHYGMTQSEHMGAAQ